MSTKYEIEIRKKYYKAFMQIKNYLTSSLY